MNSKEIKKMWSIFDLDPDSFLELRAIWPKRTGDMRAPITKHFRVTRDSIEETKAIFEKEALSLNTDGYNVYIVMNPISSGFDRNKVAASDSDIKYRRLLLIDIDRKSDKENPANDAEIEEAQKMARKIMEALQVKGWANPFLTMSGNGCHIYYKLDKIPNSKETKNEIAGLLKNLATKFNSETMEIDTSVYNASRITKVPGTIARKGNESTERKYRMAVVL
jgi:hypothetical protein